jgi:hypothetical protein
VARNSWREFAMLFPSSHIFLHGLNLKFDHCTCPIRVKRALISCGVDLGNERMAIAVIVRIPLQLSLCRRSSVRRDPLSTNGAHKILQATWCVRCGGMYAL